MGLFSFIATRKAAPAFSVVAADAVLAEIKAKARQEGVKLEITACSKAVAAVALAAEVLIQKETNTKPCRNMMAAAIQAAMDVVELQYGYRANDGKFEITYRSGSTLEPIYKELVTECNLRNIDLFKAVTEEEPVEVYASKFAAHLNN